MPIVVQCPSCMARIKVSDSRVGERVKCPGCKFQFLAASQRPPIQTGPAAMPSAETTPAPKLNPFDFYAEPQPDGKLAAEDPSEFAEIIEVSEPERRSLTPPIAADPDERDQSGFYLGYTLCGLAFVVGVIWIIAALAMDTTVSTEYWVNTQHGSGYSAVGPRVHNIGRLAERHNHLIIGGTLTALAVLVCVAVAIAHHYSGQSANGPSETGPFDKLEKLAELRARGVLTEDEFQEQKRRLLS